MVDLALNAKVYRSQEHLALSLESSRESMTLLKNDDHLLPFSGSVRRIAVIGPNADVARYGDRNA
jgi:beta-glucosidase